MKAFNSTVLPFIKQYKLILSLSILFLLLYLPIIRHLNFYQNDDWYYYRQVSLFLIGKFRLLNDIAPTFYAQGFMATVFAYIFGLSKIPYLTLIVSTVDLFIFLLILKINKIQNILIITSSFVFISFPVFSYSTLGFMSENYFLLFCLLSILFLNLYLQKSNNVFFALCLMLSFVSFFVKQNGVVLPAIYFLYFLYSKKYKNSLYSAFVVLCILVFYAFIFPKTFEMKESKFSIEPFTPTNIIFYIYITLGYFGVLALPMFSFFRVPKVSFNKKTVTTAFLSLFLLSIIYYLYSIYSTFKIYPYFGNTFAHLGYLYGSIDGKKPVAVGMSKLFLTYTNIGPFVITFLLLFISANFKKIKQNKIALFYLLAFVVFQSSGLFISKYFDRYLIVPFVLFLLFLVNYVNDFKLNRLVALFLIPFLFLNFYISYLFSWDFVLTNNYVWQKSEQLVKQGTLPENIYGNGAWVEQHNNKGIDKSQYIFYYQKNLPKEIRQNYEILETKEFSQLRPFYKASKIYLFKAK